LHRYSDMMYLVLRNIRDNDYGTTVILFLQCFYAVVWAAGRASGLKKLSGRVLAWLSVCG